MNVSHCISMKNGKGRIEMAAKKKAAGSKKGGKKGKK
jgi:hypothetical protein